MEYVFLVNDAPSTRGDAWGVWRAADAYLSNVLHNQSREHHADQLLQARHVLGLMRTRPDGWLDVGHDRLEIRLGRTSAHFLPTLRRIPDLEFLSMCTREFRMDIPETCICGWALAEAMQSGLSTSGGKDHDFLPESFAEVFGGTPEAWNELFMGVTKAYLVPVIEEAFALRYAEAAR